MTKAAWKNEGTKYALLGQLIRLVDKFLKSDHGIRIEPPLYYTDDLRRRILMMLSMNKIVQHIASYIKSTQAEQVIPVYDTNRRIRSTADMMTWFTTKPAVLTQKSQVSHVVCDSGWEDTEAYVLEKNEHVVSYAKNDHLGFKVLYTTSEGVIRNYFPDFLIRLDNGTTLVLETKGQKNEDVEKKQQALEEWIRVVNETGKFGRWESDISYSVKDVDGIIARHVK